MHEKDGCTGACTTPFWTVLFFKQTLIKALEFQIVEKSTIFIVTVQNDILLTMFLFDITKTTH